MNIYSFKVLDKKGREVSLDEYKGKVLLIINTATACGFTPQYEALEAMYKRLKDRGFEILDFPCNQFGAQAPGSDEEIASFCTLKFGTEFPQFKKLEVNGPGQSPLFAYLKEQKGFKGFDGDKKMAGLLSDMLYKADPDYAAKSDIKWNFTKFLVDRRGQVAERFEPTHDLEDIEKRVKELL
ncbi:glutathione peroxidase [bacterium]|nr:glutathione peroxidase [bacterium]